MARSIINVVRKTAASFGEGFTLNEKEQQLHYIREDLKQERAEFLAERHLHIEAEHRSAASFDKAMMTLSAASLGFSLSFINSLASEPKGVGFLYTAWITFSLALVFVTVALYQSQQAFRTACDSLEAKYLERVKPLQSEFNRLFGIESMAEEGNEAMGRTVGIENSHAETVRTLNSFAVTFFVVGTVCLVVFSISNFPNP
ncbi:hypothetical protein [Rhodocaloribacter sp.]